MTEPTPIHDELMAEYAARHKKPSMLRQLLTYLGIVHEIPIGGVDDIWGP